MLGLHCTALQRTVHRCAACSTYCHAAHMCSLATKVPSCMCTGTESNYDVLRIYTGSTTAPINLLHTLSGTAVPDSIVVPSRTALLDFITDSSSTSDGFLATAVSIATFAPTSLPSTQIYNPIYDFVGAHNINRTRNGLEPMTYSSTLEVWLSVWPSSRLGNRSVGRSVDRSVRRSVGRSSFWYAVV